MAVAEKFTLHLQTVVLQLSLDAITSVWEKRKAFVLVLVSIYRRGMLYVYVKGVTSADLFATTQNTKCYNGTWSHLQLNEKILPVFCFFYLDKFNPSSRLCGGESYNSNPTLNDKVHCLLSVIPAHNILLLEENNYIIMKMKEVRDVAKNLGENHEPQWLPHNYTCYFTMFICSYTFHIFVQLWVHWIQTTLSMQWINV